jgi:beta-hydroxylase
LRQQTYQAAVDLGSSTLRAIERLVVRYSLVETSPFLPVERFPWAATLEANWRSIRAELDDVLRDRDDLPAFQEISADQVNLTDDDRWKTFFFYGYGFKSEANCARCPKTAKLLEDVPGMTTAFFSILAPHKGIPAHRGPWKGVLRYHLGLLVPEPAQASGISVGGQVAHWEEGRSLVFDDSYEHFAWNDTEGTRVVLFMDVIRPLRPPGSWLNQAVIKAVSLSPYVQDAKRRQLEWERRFASRRSAEPAGTAHH